MSVLDVTWLDLLHELCLQNGYALRLAARHHPPAFAEPSRTELVHLDVVEPYPAGLERGGIRQRLTAGDLIVRCDLDQVDGDLDAAAQLLVELLERTRRQAA